MQCKEAFSCGGCVVCSSKLLVGVGVVYSIILLFKGVVHYPLDSCIE